LWQWRSGLTAMPRILRLSALVIAVASAFAGAVTAVLPALVVGLVTLFYNSAGGALILLGDLIGLLPHPFGVVQGTSSLPVFQQLDINAGAVVLWSAAATILCSVAAVVIVVAPTPVRNARSWLVTGLCCLLASIAGGRLVALSVIPAIAISIGHLTRQHMRPQENPTVRRGRL
jgi:hypothetical protein